MGHHPIGKNTSAAGVLHGNPGDSNWKKEVLYLSILVALCIILFFFSLGDRPLWDIDEGLQTI